MQMSVAQERDFAQVLDPVYRNSNNIWNWTEEQGLKTHAKWDSGQQPIADLLASGLANQKLTKTLSRHLMELFVIVWPSEKWLKWKVRHGFFFGNFSVIFWFGNRFIMNNFFYVVVCWSLYTNKKHTF